MLSLSEMSIYHDIEREVERARRKFPDFHSDHEGYGVLLEEMDELWDDIKADAPIEKMEREAIQVAAMAIRLIQDRRKRENAA